MRRSSEYPVDVSEAHRQMECYSPVFFRRKTEEDGSQHWQNGSETVQKCFKCDRSKPECYGARNCRHGKKADGSALNTQETIAEKFRKMKEEVQKRKASGVVVDQITC